MSGLSLPFCKLGIKETYDIIRTFIKDNINSQVAEISTDYDFCFAVSKKIKLAKEYTYQVDVNSSIFFDRKKKKPKYETRLQSNRLVKIFEMCHEKYQSYTPIIPFEAENKEALKLYIDNYLEHLIQIINEPVCECPNCNGSGIIFNLLKH